MSAAEWIAQRRELLDAATEGPWESDGSEISQHWSRPEPWKMVASSEVVCGRYCYGGAGRGIEHAPDAAFIADARTSLPAALDALEAVLTEHEPKDYGPLGVRCRTCFTGSAGYAVPAPYPCSPVRAIETALRADR